MTRGSTFEKVCRGVYATPDRRFFVEKRGENGWRLTEQGELVGYKPGALPTATAKSPIWLRNNSARAAIAWARSKIGDRAVAINARSAK